MTEQKPPDDSTHVGERFDTAFLNRGKPPAAAQGSLLARIRALAGPTVQQLAEEQRKQREIDEATTKREAESAHGVPSGVDSQPQAVDVEEPGAERKPQEVETLAAAQHVFTRVTRGESPRFLEGWQSYRWTEKGEGALSTEDVRYLEIHFEHQRSLPPGIRSRWQFFSFQDGRVVFTHVGPRLETDRSGRTHLYLAHSLVLSPEEYSKLPHGILSLWDPSLYKTEPYQLPENSPHENRWHLPIKQLVVSAINKESQGKLLPNITEGLQASGQTQLAELIGHMLEAEKMREEYRRVLIYGNNDEVTKVLKLTHQLAQQVLGVDPTQLSFTTWSPETNIVPAYFWAVGTAKKPTYASDIVHLLDANQLLEPLIHLVGDEVLKAEPEDVSPKLDVELPTKGGDIDTNFEAGNKISEEIDRPVTLEFDQPVILPPGMGAMELQQNKPLSIQGKEEMDPQTREIQFRIEKITIDAKRLKEAGIDPKDVSYALWFLKIRMAGRTEVALVALDALEKGDFQKFTDSVNVLRKQDSATRGLYGLDDDSEPFRLEDKR